MSQRFLFCSDIALYPPLLRVAELIAGEFGLEGHVLLPKEASFSPVYFPSGMGVDATATSLKIHSLPGRKGSVVSHGFAGARLKRLLAEIKPDYIWLFAEFFEGLTQQFLWHYRFQRPPRIVAYVAGNHVKGATPLLSAGWPFVSRTRLKQILLWPRLDGVAACATKAMECARRIGLPENVPVVVNYLPCFGPEEAAGEGIPLPWPRGGAVIIGFAGLLSEQKGWKVLLQALESLPPEYKVVIAGDGEQRRELEAWLQRPGLQGRAYYAGLLAKEKLLATYPLFDVFVLPSITTSHIVEQFGAVLAEAMACGVPVIGSDSGGIPEAVGQAGLIVPEGNPQALAAAIVRLSKDEALRGLVTARGRERFRTHYTCEQYARSIAGLLQIK
jgi:glycosyltransferase involved in cell wall biosynthesis